jgi:hypothetical protein
MQYVVCRCFILQYVVDHYYLFRSLMRSSSGLHIKTMLHKIEQAIHIHVKNIQKLNQLKCRRFVMDLGTLCVGDCLCMYGRLRQIKSTYFVANMTVYELEIMPVSINTFQHIKVKPSINCTLQLGDRFCGPCENT